jgi:hypothetical protein
MHMLQLWDDRAVQVEPNTGVVIEEKLGRYKGVCDSVRTLLEATPNKSEGVVAALRALQTFTKE